MQTFLPLAYLSRFKWPSAQAVGAIAAALAFYLVFRNLGQGSIDISDESLTAGRSLSLYHSGDIFQLSINGETSLRKPPLLYILNALAFALFGVNEFSLRIANALFGFATFAVIGLATRQWFGARYAGIAILLLCGSSLFLDYSREALTDTAFIFGITLAASVAASAVSAPRMSPQLKLIFAIGIFIAAFGKGLFALILPAYCLLFCALLRRDSVGAFVLPTLLALLPLLLWIIGALIAHPDFYRQFFQQEFFERVNPNSTYLPLQIHGPFWYFKKLWDWFAMTGYLGLACAVWKVRDYHRNARNEKSAADMRNYFIAGFALFFIAALSLSSHKRDAYILPLFPLLCLVIVSVLSSLPVRIERHRNSKLFIGLVTLAIVVGAVRTLITNQPIPDYRPAEKQLALAIRASGQTALPIYTDNFKAARILHFYLDRPITVVPSLTNLAPDAKILIALTPLPFSRQIKNYYLSIPE